MRKTIFIIDDSSTNLMTARDALSSAYKVITLSSAAKMFALLKKVKPDLILLDIEMPEMDGLEALKILKSDVSTKDIPVIFLTVTNTPAVEACGFHLGVVDFLVKPFSKLVLLSRIKTHLDIDEMIRKQTIQLRRLQNSTVTVMAKLVESRDMKTGGHTERTAAYIEVLIEALIGRKLCQDIPFDINIDSFTASARLHDVGKIVVPDTILNKTGELSDKEFAIIKKHAAVGEQIIDEMTAITGTSVFLQDAKFFAGYHHERWNGTGYPYGLSGDEIPFQGRIMAIADVYDALVSERPYKQPITHQQSVDIIMDSAGAHFDPKIVQAFYEVKDRFEEISYGSFS